MRTNAIIFRKPGDLGVEDTALTPPGARDTVVDTLWSGISSGTERMLLEGTMPAFPGMGYPLVPGYEAVGTVRAAGSRCRLRAGERVFVPGSVHWGEELRGLFGASASVLVADEARVTPIASLPAERGVLLALAATAMHKIGRASCRERV